MAIEKVTAPHRSSHPNSTLFRAAPNEIERLEISKCLRAWPTNDGSISLAEGVVLQTLLDAVEDQRVNLVNVLRIVHSMSAGFTDTAAASAPEITEAFELLEQEIQRVVAGLKQASVRGST